MGHPTSFLPEEIEQMADTKEKKPRTAAQAAQNQLARNTAAWLEAKGLGKQVTYQALVKKMKKEGASSAEINAAVRAKMANNAKTRANKKAAPKPNNAATKKNNAKPNNGTKKVRTPAQLAANAAMKNTATKLKAAGVKFLGASYKEYKAAKAAGRTNDDIFAELKAKYPAVNNTGKPIVTKRAVAVTKRANAVAPVAAAVNAPAGSYVCDRCRLVTNTRKNNKKNVMNSNYGAPGYWYGQ